MHIIKDVRKQDNNFTFFLVFYTAPIVEDNEEVKNCMVYLGHINICDLLPLILSPCHNHVP
jgi:hypothetical protein